MYQWLTKFDVYINNIHIFLENKDFLVLSFKNVAISKNSKSLKANLSFSKSLKNMKKYLYRGPSDLHGCYLACSVKVLNQFDAHANERKESQF